MSTHQILVVPVKLDPHPNADSLAIVRIDDCQCVVKASDWQNVDRGIHIPPDYMVPARFVPFLAKEGEDMVRIKPVRLRGELSWGLLLPMSVLGFKSDMPSDKRPIGEDVMGMLGIERYEPPVPLSTGGDDVSGPTRVMAPKYDVEPFEKYASKMFTPGEVVFVTEKIHGCMQYEQTVRMADGTTKKIGQIRVGDEVLGLDENERVIPSTVTQVFNNGPSDAWLRIKCSRAGVGRGNSYASICCTPNHKFYVERDGEWQYVPGSELVLGDTVLSVRSDYDITPLQRQIILGKLLGDGTLSFSGTTADLKFGHKVDHAQYVHWTSQALDNLMTDWKDEQESGYGTQMMRRRTHRNYFIAARFGDMYQDGKKVAPAWIAEELTPLALAFWYMDDGSLAHDEGQEDRALFAVCDFSREDCEVLITGLQRLGIKSPQYYESEGYSRIRLNADDAERLFLLVAPYMPPCMRYKLPERYRGGAGWLPTDNSMSYKTHTVRQKVLAIEDISATVQSRIRYDIETETHNFFAGDILVHNSNARYVFSDGELFCGSRANWKKFDPRSIWWRAVETHQEIRAFCEANPDTVLYGEVYGPVQSLRYGSPKTVRFAAFDVLRNGEWLSLEERRELLNTAGVPHVPVLGQYKFDRQLLQSLASGPSLVDGADHIREGIVVEPVAPRNDPKIGRVKLKIVAEDYLTGNY